MAETAQTERNSTVDPAEIERFSRIAEQWWDPTGKFAPLHRLNPVRIRYIRDHAASHWRRDALSGDPLQGLSLRVERGSFVVVIGGNGSGKSTLLNAVAGVFPLDAGHIRIGSDDVTHWPEHRRAAVLGRVFQNPFSGTAPSMTIAETLALAAKRGLPRGCLALARGQHAAHDDFLDLRWRDARAFDRGADRGGAELARGEVFQIALKTAHGRAGGRDDDDGIVHERAPSVGAG